MNTEQAWDHFVRQVMNVAGGIEQPERAVAAGKLYAAHAVAEARAPLGDSQLLTLFRQWSEDHYCASFMSPSPDTVSRFLDSLEPHNLPAQLEDYETQFLDEVRSQLAQRETVAALAAKETGDE